MLIRTPQEMRDLRLWLLSLGIDADKALQRNPGLVKHRLQGLQRKMDAFHAYNLPGLVSFLYCATHKLWGAVQTVYLIIQHSDRAS